MDEYISKQVAIDALDQIFDRCEEIEAHLPEGDPDRIGYKMFPDYITVWKYLHQLPSAQPEPCEDAVSRKAVEEMLKNGFPTRGMWEIEGDIVKQTVCETLVDALMDLEKLPSAEPEIIRCRDCEHHSGSYCHYKYSYGAYVRDNHYCGWAERRIDE